jgi:mannose/cellobiose epimerase-like protein (N-acyl-D-glucosamine 2-epimerase family)
MGDRSRKTLLEPGHEAEWAELNREKREALTPPPDTPVAELLRQGQHLSRQAFKLLRAVDRAENERAARPA